MKKRREESPQLELVFSPSTSSTDVSSSRHPQAAAANFPYRGAAQKKEKKRKEKRSFRKKAPPPHPPPAPAPQYTEASRRQEEEKSYFVSQLRLHIKGAE